MLRTNQIDHVNKGIPGWDTNKWTQGTWTIGLLEAQREAKDELSLDRRLGQSGNNIQHIRKKKETKFSFRKKEPFRRESKSFWEAEAEQANPGQLTITGEHMARALTAPKTQAIVI